MRVRLDHPGWDYVNGWRDHRWDSNWIERPRLWASAVALALGAPKVVCDPACGDASVVTTADAICPIDKAYLCDLSPDTLDRLVPAQLRFNVERRVGDLRETLNQVPDVDAIVLTEILEHLDDPDSVLRLARAKARWLVASSPIVPNGMDHTAQHLWAFDREGYREMLVAADWQPQVWQTVGCVDHPYEHGFQVWGCK
jgi:hypothetical protein